MARISRRGMIKGIGATSALAIAGCLDAADADVRLGVIMPTTGDLADLGAPIRDAALLPVDQLEDEGVDFEFDTRTEDTETDPEAGISAAEALVDAGYPTITGPAASDVTIPVAQDVYLPNEVLGISPSSTAPVITDIEGRFFLRTCPSDALQGVLMAEIARDQFGADSTSCLSLNDDYGQGLAEVYMDSFEELGGTVVENVPFEPEQPSYNSELGTALEGDPDSLMIVGFPESGEQIFRDYYADFDLGIPILVPDGLIDDDLPANVDNPMSDVTGTNPAAVGPGRDTFADLFDDVYGHGVGPFTANAYDASALHILATLRAGELDGPAIADEVRAVAQDGGELVGPDNLDEAVEMAANGEDIEYEGASGIIQFDDNGDTIATSYDIVEFSMDGTTVVDTIDLEAD